MYTVLHIENSGLFTTILKKSLDNKGYNYISTDSFKEAFQILYEEDVDLIITSLVARGSTIEDFLADINRSNYSEVPIFLVTSSKMDDEKKKLMNMGITDYIVKDSFIDEISKHIDVVFQEDQYMQDLREAKIAVLDDSDFELKIRKDIFDRYELQNVDYYNSGKELMGNGKKYDIYLIDIILNNEFGRNVIMSIRRNNINASIIAITGITNSKTIASILSAGADDYITKPIDENIFIAKLKANVRLYSLNKQVKNLLMELTKSH